MVNGIFFLIPVSNISLLVYKNAFNFWILTLYLAVLPDSLIRWSSFSVESIGFFLFKKIFYSFIFRERGREREREGEKHQCVVVSHASLYWRPDQQPRHVPWLGIKPVTLGFTGWPSIHWATPARVYRVFFIYCHVICKQWQFYFLLSNLDSFSFFFLSDHCA